MNASLTATEATTPRSVDPAAIERELSALWRTEAERRKQAGGDGKALARTLLLNLIVVAPDQVQADRARDIIVTLTRRQPARSIVVILDDQSKEMGLEAWISLLCDVSTERGRDQVCGEEIALTAKGSAILDLPGAILPLLLTGAPVFLWWQVGNPVTHPIFEHLLPAMDRLILDSLTFSSPLNDFTELARSLAADPQPVVLSDLSWARLTFWRSVTAQIFDPQTRRPYLNELTSARLKYYEGSPSLAWLFTAWLASRLNWKLTQREANVWRFADGQTIEFDAVPAGEETPGYFAGLELRARDGADFGVLRQPQACAITRMQVQDVKTERTLSVRYESLADCLARELDRLNRSATFEAALNLIAGLS